MAMMTPAIKQNKPQPNDCCTTNNSSAIAHRVNPPRLDIQTIDLNVDSPTPLVLGPLFVPNSPPNLSASSFFVMKSPIEHDNSISWAS